MIGLDGIVQNYQEGRWNELKAFIKRNYSEKYILQNKKYFDWIHVNNPFNRKRHPAFKLLVIKNRIVGHVGLIPLRLNYFGTEVDSAAPCNLMIDKDYRNSGLGIFLIRSLMEEYDIFFCSWGEKKHLEYLSKHAGLERIWRFQEMDKSY